MVLSGWSICPAAPLRSRWNAAPRCRERCGHTPRKNWQPQGSTKLCDALNITLTHGQIPGLTWINNRAGAACGAGGTFAARAEKTARRVIAGVTGNCSVLRIAKLFCTACSSARLRMPCNSSSQVMAEIVRCGNWSRRCVARAACAGRLPRRPCLPGHARCRRPDHWSQTRQHLPQPGQRRHCPLRDAIRANTPCAAAVYRTQMSTRLPSETRSHQRFQAIVCRRSAPTNASRMMAAAPVPCASPPGLPSTAHPPIR